MSSFSSSKYMLELITYKNFELDNYDMESSKRRSFFTSLIFILARVLYETFYYKKFDVN